MARRSRPNVFGLAFLDAMTCGLGSVILLYMIINANVRVRADEAQHDLAAEVERLEELVLDGSLGLVRLRNSIEEVENDRTLSRGLARRLLEALEALRRELATMEESTLARREHVRRLQSDLKTLEDEARRLSAAQPDDEIPGDRTRAFVGDGDRQYLTGLKLGGDRIFILLDSSSSMLDETIVNVIRRRNLSDDRKIRARKWQQAVSTVDWLTTQLPRSSTFQIYTFADGARPVLAGTGGRWLDASQRDVLEAAVQAVREIVPDGGTSLHHGLAAVAAMRPQPDNLILLIDGLPTRGAREPKRGTVSSQQRIAHFEQAIQLLPRGLPVNTVLFPMEGDPAAPSAYWKLALATRGSFFSPARDWP